MEAAKIKREREEFSQASGASEALGKANKELEDLRADRENKALRITELEALCAAHADDPVVQTLLARARGTGDFSSARACGKRLPCGRARANGGLRLCRSPPRSRGRRRRRWRRSRAW